MQKTKVLFAYCHELDRCMSIDGARKAFFAVEQAQRRRFRFSCSERDCGVLISGVNYTVKAEDGHKFRAAHFRSPHPHKPGCVWAQFTEEMEQEKRADESDEDFAERKARRKLTDFINYFDPTPEDAQTTGAALSDGDNLPTPAASGGRGEGGTGNRRWSQYTRTSQLQRLTDSWQEAKNTLSAKEFSALRLTLPHHGRVAYHRYITHINRGLHNDYAGVIYGGGRLQKRYGKGFLFRFYDRVDEKPVMLYVSKDMMAQRGGAYIDEILNTPGEGYFRVFLLNPAVSEKENSRGQPVINLEISALRQIALYHEVNSRTDAVAASVDRDADSPA